MDKEKKTKTKQDKLLIVFAIVLAVLILLPVCTKIVSSSKMPFHTGYVYALMPKSLDLEFNDEEITFYIEKNKEFNKEKDQPLSAYKVYYYENNDKKTDKIYLDNGQTMVAQTESSSLMTLNFLADAAITGRIINRIANTVLIVDAVLLVGYAIFIWYVLWSKKYDKEHGKE